jgi:hypothetical protein
MDGNVSILALPIGNRNLSALSTKPSFDPFVQLQDTSMDMRSQRTSSMPRNLMLKMATVNGV